VNRSGPRAVSRTNTSALIRPSTARWIVESGLSVARAISVRVALLAASMASSVAAAGSVRIEFITASIYARCVTVKSSPSIRHRSDEVFAAGLRRGGVRGVATAHIHVDGPFQDDLPVRGAAPLPNMRLMETLRPSADQVKMSWLDLAIC